MLCSLKRPYTQREKSKTKIHPSVHQRDPPRRRRDWPTRHFNRKLVEALRRWQELRLGLVDNTSTSAFRRLNGARPVKGIRSVAANTERNLLIDGIFLALVNDKQKELGAWHWRQCPNATVARPLEPPTFWN